MPCLIALLALLTPRLVLVLLWLLTSWFAGMFDNVLWPALGFLLLPTTLLWYSVVYHWWGGAWDVWAIAGLVLAVILDATSSSSGMPRPPARHAGCMSRART
jgi:hypothetical protein